MAKLKIDVKYLYEEEDFNDYYDKVYDKYQDYLTLRMTLYVNEVDENGNIIKDAYQIYCSYNTKNTKYKINQTPHLTPHYQ